MHELAIAQSITEVVAARAAERYATRVLAVRLLVGEASGVAPDALTACFAMLASLDPLLEGARLDIEARPHRAWCRRCETEFAIVHFVAQCPACGEWSDIVVSGTELQVLAMEIAPEPEAGPEPDPEPLTRWSDGLE